MGRLDRLELDNFKSYAGHVVVGPFKGFTSIIGPNGAGKSNLMDAISFVLGVRTAQLRGNQLRDLVYRNTEDPNDEVHKRKASVKLVYQTEEGVEIEFMRGVTLGGSSDYRVDGKSMTLEQYNRRLAELGILVKARNFLVFQNEVESIASRSPKELTSLFEEISGSGELKADYEAARAEKDAAEEEVMNIWRKKKGMAAEKKQYKEQKEEAEKYRRIEQELGNAKTQLALYQLYHIDEEMKALLEDIEQQQVQLQESQKESETKKSQVAAVKKEALEAEKLSSSQERKARRLQEEIEKMQPLEVKYESEKKATLRRIKADERTLGKVESDTNAQSEEIAMLEQELETVVQDIEGVRAEIVKAEESSLPPEVIAEYKRLKEIARTRTSVVQQEIEVAKRAVSDARLQKEALEKEIETNETRKATAKDETDNLGWRMREIRREKSEAMAEMDKLKEEQTRSREIWTERNQVRHDLERVIAETTERLRDAKADQNESARERKFSDAFENMKRLFPGVHGRLSDLCKPTQAKYREAVAVIFGKMMDAIVVDNERTASECISFLKEQRAGIGNFLPIADLRPRMIDESLRRLGGTARLAIDVVAHDQYYTPAVHYAAGSAVVCDSLSEARSLHYERGRRIKICSVDGTLISKAGFMTGGSSPRSGRAKKWDRAETDALKRKRAAAQRQLLEMGSARDQRSAEAQLAEQIDTVSRRLSMLDVETRSCENSAGQLRASIVRLSSLIDSSRPKLEKAKNDLSAAESTLNNLQNTLDNLEASTFGDFPQRHSVSSVAEFEASFVTKSTPLRNKLLTLQTHQSTLNSELKYSRTKLKPSYMRRLRNKIKLANDKLAGTQEQLGSLRTKRAELEERLSSLRERSREKKEAHEQQLEALKELEGELEAMRDSQRQLEMKIESKTNRINSIKEKRKTLLTDCEVDQVRIPLRTNDPEHADDQSMDEANDLGSAEIDYGELRRSLKKRQSEVKRNAVQTEFLDQVKNLSVALESLAPNLRAQERMGDIQKRLAEVQKEAEKARETAREASERFEGIKTTRQRLFNNCFNHVADGINETYRQLTRSTNYPMGGNAYLSLDQQDEPYNGGVKFNAMPPTKRFRDMDQLSGGERTVAALALLFAIHDFRPSPFFVLDEVDAALDNLNVGKVSAYVRSRAPELQTIVISLKDAFYEKADALVGIYRDAEVNSSRLLTLDLAPFKDSSGMSREQPVT